jgi:hypothetical protein
VSRRPAQPLLRHQGHRCPHPLRDAHRREQVQQGQPVLGAQQPARHHAVSEYSAICGYTEADLDEVFAPELAGLDRAEIRAWYNGYNWTGEAVYNPFDVLLLFKSASSAPGGSRPATPTFLVDLLTERHTDLPPAGAPDHQRAVALRLRRGTHRTEALLWQTGYLTIDSVQQVSAPSSSTGCATRTWRCAPH